MGRPRKDVEEVKNNITIRIPQKQIKQLKSIKNYNTILSKLIDEYLKKSNKKD